MARKQIQHPENYNAIFPTRLRELMKNRKQQELATYLGKTRQAVSYYLDGSSSPDWETLAKIASFFDVSADFLIGLSCDPNRSPSAVDTLGLSNENVQFLRDPGTAIGRHTTTPAFRKLIDAIVNDILDALRNERLYNEFQLMQKIIKRIMGMNYLDDPDLLPPVADLSVISNYMPTPFEVERYIEHCGLFVLNAEDGAEYYAGAIGKKIGKHLISKYLTPYLDSHHNNVEIMEVSAPLLYKEDNTEVSDNGND